MVGWLVGWCYNSCIWSCPTFAVEFIFVLIHTVFTVCNRLLQNIWYRNSSCTKCLFRDIVLIWVHIFIHNALVRFVCCMVIGIWATLVGRSPRGLVSIGYSDHNKWHKQHLQMEPEVLLVVFNLRGSLADCDYLNNFVVGFRTSSNLPSREFTKEVIFYTHLGSPVGCGEALKVTCHECVTAYVRSAFVWIPGAPFTNMV